MAKKLFSADDFDKHISVGDELVFDKPTLKTVKIDLIWGGQVLKDLDLCAFMLGDDGMIKIKDDLVYFKSQRRWVPVPGISDPAFDPLKGRVSGTWKEENFKNPQKWMDATLPLSADDSVIGSWDDMAGDDGDDGDDECGETMHVLLDEVDVSQYSSIVFAAVVAKSEIQKGHSFADAYEPVARIYDADEDKLIAEYKLAEKFPGKDAVCFGRMAYNEETIMWQFEPMADGYNGGMEFLATEVFG